MKNLTISKLKNEQIEILCWLYNRHGYDLTPLRAWEMLFRERDSKQPDKCIAMYDGLSNEEKSIVEMLFSQAFYYRYFNKPESYQSFRKGLPKYFEMLFEKYYLKSSKKWKSLI